jgi:hypothetical protein
VSCGLFNLFQISLKEDVLSLEDSDSEYFDTAKAGSSADEIDDCLSAVSEGLAVAEVTDPKSSEMPVGAEMMDFPGRKVRRKNKGRSRYGPGLAGRRKRQALIRQESQGGLCRGTGVIRELLRCGCPMEGCGSLTCGGTVCRHISPGFSGTWFAQGKILGGSGRLHCRRSRGDRGGPVWLRGRTTECHRVPGGS